MNWLALIDPFGRLGRLRFAIAIVGVLLLSVASLALFFVPFLEQVKLSPFAFVQAVLLWAWFSLHVNRLRDAGIGKVTAVGLSIIGSLMTGFFVIAAIGFVMATPENSLFDNLSNSEFLDAIREFIQDVFEVSEEEAAQRALVVGHQIPWMRLLLATILTLGFSIWAGWQRSVVSQT